MGQVCGKDDSNCKGFQCGSNFMKDSIPSNRLDLGSMLELLRDKFEKFGDEEWFKQLICSLDCQPIECVLNLNSTSFTVPAEGGEIELVITTNGEYIVTMLN